jgi:hypothetical protein
MTIPLLFGKCVIAASLMLLLRGTTTVGPRTPSALARLTVTADLMLESLNQFVAFQTVSSMPRYRADCRRGASYLRSVFQNFGAVTESHTTPSSSPSSEATLQLLHPEKRFFSMVTTMLYQPRMSIASGSTIRSRLLERVGTCMVVAFPTTRAQSWRPSTPRMS